MPKEIKPWKTLRSELVFDHKWYKLRRDHVTLPNGRVLDDYFVSVRPNVVLIFALTTTDEVLFVRQYKHAAGQILLELPGGIMDEGETLPLEAAKRELLEETGHTSDEIELLQSVIDNPTKDTNTIYFFLARNAQQVAAQDLDETEEIEVVKVPLNQVEAQIQAGNIRVSGSVALCLLAMSKLRQVIIPPPPPADVDEAIEP
ncbi:NUDIX hydrolase [Hymenobacter terrenus]|uniref:NUDIX hydrolase n=1 Tax=Hymenobacter terrenus TaxID=1629124 RepID=UPI00061966D4|nr:NUDIX hydrolase [Hymenobacter terrenus]